MCVNCNPTSDLQQGLDGFNAFTIVTTNFVMPAEGANVTVTVSNTGQFTGAWAVPGQIVYVQTAGYFQVVSSTATSMVLTNIENSSTGAYSSNAAPTTGISSGNRVSPAGVQGPTGASSGNILIDVDYTEYSNTTTGSYTNQKTINLPSAIFSTNKDTIELQVALVNLNTSGSTSTVRIQLYDGSNYINLIPSVYTGGITLPSGSGGNPGEAYLKLHISRNSSTSINVLSEYEWAAGALSGDTIFYNLAGALNFKYRTVNLNPITLSNSLQLLIDTKPADSNGVKVEFVKCIKQKLV